MSKCLFCSKKNFLLYFLKKYYNLMYIGYRYRYQPIRQKNISVFYWYRPIRNLNLLVIIGICQYEKKLIGRPLGFVFQCKSLTMYYIWNSKKWVKVPNLVTYWLIFHVIRFFCCLWCQRIVKNFKAENWWIILPEWRGAR